MEHRNINTVGTIFNDFLGLYTGERPVGIHELIQASGPDGIVV